MKSSSRTIAETHFRAGCASLAQGNMRDAEACFRAAVTVLPDFGEALTNLAYVLDHRGDVRAAEQTYGQALAAGADSVQLHLNLGAILAGQKRFLEAKTHYLAAIQRDGTSSAAWSNLGVLYLGLQQDDEAEKCLHLALAIDPRNSKAQFNLSYLYLRHGRFEDGWRSYEARDWYATWQQHFTIPRWSGEPLQQKSLVIVCEAGHGDAIQFSRYAALVKGLGATPITLVCHPALKSLMQTLDAVTSVIGVGESLARDGGDYWTPLMSLPFLLQTRTDCIPAPIPYLRADPLRMQRWDAELPNGKLRVGLVWKGNPLYHNDADRSLPHLQSLAPLWQVGGIDFISLQKGAGEDELGTMGTDLPLLDVGTRIGDFADTAAIVSKLDLVVCVDTAVAHLASALGRPCWLMLPYYMPDWRWGVDGETSAWYPQGLRLFRQAKDTSWDQVVQGLAHALAQFVQRQAAPRVASGD